MTIGLVSAVEGSKVGVWGPIPDLNLLNDYVLTASFAINRDAVRAVAAAVHVARHETPNRCSSSQSGTLFETS
jgi:hypothetical protein